MAMTDDEAYRFTLGAILLAVRGDADASRSLGESLGEVDAIDMVTLFGQALILSIQAFVILAAVQSKDVVEVLTQMAMEAAATLDQNE